MTAGNAIERLHKNIQEFRNYMLDELHFPYIVFLQGPNFAAQPIAVKRPDGREVPIRHDSRKTNRIDRVIASNFGMKINENDCKNIFVERDKKLSMLEAASIYCQIDTRRTDDM